MKLYLSVKVSGRMKFFLNSTLPSNSYEEGTINSEKVEPSLNEIFHKPINEKILLLEVSLNRFLFFIVSVVFLSKIFI